MPVFGRVCKGFCYWRINCIVVSIVSFGCYKEWRRNWNEIFCYRHLLESMQTGLSSGDIHSLHFQMSPIHVVAGVISRDRKLLLQSSSQQTTKATSLSGHNSDNSDIGPMIMVTICIPLKPSPIIYIFTGCAGTTMWTGTLTRCCTNSKTLHRALSIFLLSRAASRNLSHCSKWRPLVTTGND